MIIPFIRTSISCIASNVACDRRAIRLDMKHKLIHLIDNTREPAHLYFGEAEDDLPFMYEVHAKYSTSGIKRRPIEAKELC